MDEATATARDRLTRWIEESQAVLAAMPEILEAAQQASLRAEQAEREAERLRRELAEARKELTDVRTAAESQQRTKVESQGELDELRRENATLKAEKDEAAQAFARLLETVQSTNHIAQKLGVTRSPFARPHREPAAPGT